MEKFENFKRKAGDDARKIVVGIVAAAAPFASTPASAQNEKVVKALKDEQKISVAYKAPEVAVSELFSRREIISNKGEDFLNKVEYWHKEHSPNGKNYQSLKDGWERLLQKDDFLKVKRIMEREGVPFELVFIALAESYWRNATSPKGASGPWQFMPATAGRFGLRDRANVTKSTEAACEYLKELHALAKKCADEAGVSVTESDLWIWAMFSYNRGEGNVLRTPKGSKKGDFFRYKGDVNEYVKNCKIKESANYAPKIFGIIEASRDMFIKREQVATLAKK